VLEHLVKVTLVVTIQLMTALKRQVAVVLLLLAMLEVHSQLLALVAVMVALVIHGL
jgi:hypothetical protein